MGSLSPRVVVCPGWDMVLIWLQCSADSGFRQVKLSSCVVVMLCLGWHVCERNWFVALCSDSLSDLLALSHSREISAL